ncbi:hypothetical protein ACHAWF_004826, partial [Thalassiosira exigua]
YLSNASKNARETEETTRQNKKQRLREEAKAKGQKPRRFPHPTPRPHDRPCLPILREEANRPNRGQIGCSFYSKDPSQVNKYKHRSDLGRRSDGGDRRTAKRTKSNKQANAREGKPPPPFMMAAPTTALASVVARRLAACAPASAALVAPATRGLHALRNAGEAASLEACRDGKDAASLASPVVSPHPSGAVAGAAQSRGIGGGSGINDWRDAAPVGTRSGAARMEADGDHVSFSGEGGTTTFLFVNRGRV